MNARTSPLHTRSPGLLARALGTVLRLLLLAVGAVVGLATLALGLLLASGLVAWALLRGRRPVLNQAFRWRGPRPGAGGRVAPGEIVDAEVREVDEAPDARDARDVHAGARRGLHARRRLQDVQDVVPLQADR